MDPDQDHLERLKTAIDTNRKWMQDCGGDLGGYVARYGSMYDPRYYGNGGEAMARLYSSSSFFRQIRSAKYIGADTDELENFFRVLEVMDS